MKSHKKQTVETVLPLTAGGLCRGLDGAARAWDSPTWLP